MRRTISLFIVIPLFGINNSYVFSQYNENVDTNKKLRAITKELTEAEKNDDLKTFLSFYDTSIISMPEFQPLLRGRSEIEAYYKEIFNRQKIKSFEKKTDEIINLGKTVIEFGTFKKEYTDSKTDSLVTQNGKFCHIWDAKPGGKFKLKGEVFGFFHPVKDPSALVVQLDKKQTINPVANSEEKLPFELRAYNALNEKYVKDGSGALRAGFYTVDARIMPFARPPLSGMKEIKPYLTGYVTHSNTFNIDSIWVKTYDSEYFDDYVLEYSMFKVKWTTPDNKGQTEGKGFRVWKRQEDKSLRMFREIGTHDHIQ